MIEPIIERDKISEQCLRRVKNYRTQHRLEWSEQYHVHLAEEVAGIIRKTLAQKPSRITADGEAVVQTTVPASYIDEVIKYYQAESSRVRGLRQGDDTLWTQLLGPIESCVRGWLARHYLPGLCATPFDHLVLEIVNQTFVRVMDSEFASYCYDCPLNAWIIRFAHNVGMELLRDNATYQQKIQSLDDSLPGTLDIEVGDTISDPAVYAHLDRVQARLVIERALPALSRDQATVIRLILDHKSIQEIACVMNRSPKAIYSLKERAVVNMQRYLRFHGEF